MSSTEFDISFDLPKNQSNVIKVIGVGGGGSNAINHMYEQGINGVDFVVCNTDAQALENSTVPIKIQLGVNLTEGLGAGANPEIGEKAALESFDDLKNMLDTNTKMIFITAGMGGGTGTGAAPIIAKQAKDMGILTVGIVTIPFQFEGKIRCEQAQHGVEKLRANVDSLIVINNNKLREVYGNLGFKAGFSKADEVLATASRGIAEVITHHYTQNIDLRDAKTVLSNSGTAIMGSASASGSNRAQEAISKALDSPLLNDNKISGALNVLLLIVSGSEEITIDEIGEINDHIQAEAGNSANIIMGVGDDESLDESISVTIIATGFNPEQQNNIVNTESKKIIHTLEDEQKAEQKLKVNKPLGGSRMTPSSTAWTYENKPSEENQSKPEEPQAKESQPKKVVHRLGDGEESKVEEKKQMTSEAKAMGLIPSSELIRNLNVDYELVKYEEDDFVIIDSDEALRDMEVNEAEEEVAPQQSNEEEEDNGQAMFTFDFPLKEEVSRPAEPKQPEPQQKKTEEKPTVYKLEEEAKSIEVHEEIEIVPGNSKGEKRYSLEDYMDLEKDIESAKPNQKESESEPKDDPIVFERRRSEEVKQEPQEPANEDKENEEVDPLNNPISEDLISRAAERRARMKNFNYKFRNSNNIEEIAKQPAYKRAGIDLDGNPTDQKLSRTTINSDDDDDINLRSNNSFLHDNVD